MVGAIHIKEFPRAALQRNARCTVSDAWSLTPWLKLSRPWIEMRKTFRVQKREGPFSLVGTPAGSYWIPERDILTLAETEDEQSRDVYSGGMVDVRPGDVVLDCGANVGVYTRHALQKGARLVVAIEPAPESLECLRRNLAPQIADGRVVVYPKGVWNRDEELQLSVGPQWASTASSVVLDRGAKGPTIPLTTIDKLVAELNLASVDFVKMDIEGAEMQALEGAAQTVRRFKPRMAISLEHRPSDPQRIPEYAQKLWPEYIFQCGPCTSVNGSIQPDVMFARPR
jgi:FkbM family methyltransferase